MKQKRRYYKKKIQLRSVNSSEDNSLVFEVVQRFITLCCYIIQVVLTQSNLVSTDLSKRRKL